MITGWKAWFTEKRHYTSKDTNFEALPSDGCLGFKIFYSATTGLFLKSQDYYFKHDKLIGGDLDKPGRDVRQEIMDRYPGAIIIRGKWTDDEDMERVDQEMREAEMWP
jgi:hypothetical protein